MRFGGKTHRSGSSHGCRDGGGGGDEARRGEGWRCEWLFDVLLLLMLLLLLLLMLLLLLLQWLLNSLL